MTCILPNDPSGPNGPSVSCPFAQGMAESNSDLSSAASTFSQSLMWRSKPSPSATWSRRLKREKWLGDLYSRTLNPSLTGDFLDWWTESLAGIPASPSAQQVSEPVRTTPDTSGPGSQTELGFAGQGGASSRMSRDTSARDSERSAKTWKTLVTQRRGEYSRRLKSARLTNASGSSSWPTAASRDWKDSPGMAVESVDKSGKPRNRTDQLARAVYNDGPHDPANRSTNGSRQGCVDRQTPTAGLSPPGRKPSGAPNLIGQARDEQWPTATASDWKDGRESYRNRYEGRPSSMLPSRVKDEQWATPHTNCHTGTGEKGQGGPNLQTQTSQQNARLNPRWVETLMGLPQGWVSPEPVTQTTCTNRTDELRILGNGVVPQVAAKAFKNLYEELALL